MKYLLLPCFLAVLSYAVPASATSELPLAQDLRADAHQASREGLLILVFYSASSCSYCKVVYELYLQPMYASGEYREKALFRVIDVESYDNLRDFKGKASNHQAFAQRQGVGFTPVIRLYDGSGKELVPELYGYTSPDFYAAMLEQAIDDAAGKLRQR